MSDGDVGQMDETESLFMSHHKSNGNGNDGDVNAQLESFVETATSRLNQQQGVVQRLSQQLQGVSDDQVETNARANLAVRQLAEVLSVLRSSQVRVEDGARQAEQVATKQKNVLNGMQSDQQQIGSQVHMQKVQNLTVAEVNHRRNHIDSLYRGRRGSAPTSSDSRDVMVDDPWLTPANSGNERPNPELNRSIATPGINSTVV